MMMLLVALQYIMDGLIDGWMDGCLCLDDDHVDYTDAELMPHLHVC